MVLNRLRWIVSATPLQVENREAATQVNIAFAEVDGKIAHTDVFESCERFAGNMRENKVFNSIQLVVTHERRAREDRRKQSIPVAVDRRKQERRG